MSEVHYYKGKKYRKVERKANPGELILTTATRDKYWRDLVYEVYQVSPSATFVQVYGQAYRPPIFISNADYVVLEPLESGEEVSDRDLIVKLSQTVAKLETRVKELEEDSEMLIDDVVMLDERTQEDTETDSDEDIILTFGEWKRINKYAREGRL